MNPIEQIIDIYINQLSWIEEKDRARLRGYVSIALERGNLFWAVDESGNVIGVCETLKITYEQLGRIVCKEDFFIDLENTTDGDVALVNQVWIDKECRHGKVFKTMMKEWYRRFHTCKHFMGHARRKTVGMYKSFKRDNLVSSIFTQGE
jgi:hypothetical protein